MLIEVIQSIKEMQSHIKIVFDWSISLEICPQVYIYQNSVFILLFLR